MRHNDRYHMQIIKQSFKQKNIQTTYLIAGMPPQNYFKDAIEMFVFVRLVLNYTFRFLWNDLFHVNLLCNCMLYVYVCSLSEFVEWDILFRAATS